MEDTAFLNSFSDKGSNLNVSWLMISILNLAPLNSRFIIWLLFSDFLLELQLYHVQYLDIIKASDLQLF